MLVLESQLKFVFKDIEHCFEKNFVLPIVEEKDLGERNQEVEEAHQKAEAKKVV